jgi:Xaa-Pro aminopeptidase
MMQQSEFKRRRRQLMRLMGDNTIAIIPAAGISPRNRDVEYTYRQDSDFQYLTGFPEPEALAVLIPGRKEAEYILFCRERDPEKEMWDGKRAGLEGAAETFGADDAFPFDDLEDILSGLIENREKIYIAMGKNPDLDHQIGEWVLNIRENSRAGIKAPLEFVDLDHVVHDLRLYKSRAEIAVMRKAAKISAAAHKQLMKVCEPGMNERQLQVEFAYFCGQQGAVEQAYPSIVGGGDNACILHYIDNNEELISGDLVLIDAGCELACYASDITRTFPVNGVFSPAQRDLYQLVLDAQHAAIAAVKPGAKWDDPHNAAVKVITKGLVKLGLLKGKVSQLIKDTAYRTFFMHRTGHWLGMDVHDVGDYRVADVSRELEPGMVLTVEPGLYVARGSKTAKKWWGIGIRIEDDILVTKEGCDVLSSAVPKEISDIESLMATAKK